MTHLFRLLLLCFLSNSLQAQIDLREYDYSKVDNLILAKDPESLELFADFINENFRTEHEKFRAIYIWVTENIDDNDSALDSNVSAVFNSGQATASGAAALIKVLCDSCRLKCKVVTGIWKYNIEFDYGIKRNHAWNSVVLSGNEYPADAYMGSQGFAEEYFLTPPATFLLDHFPENSRDQFVSEPIKEEQFLNSPLFLLKAINYEVISFSPSKGTIK
ncbi:MAG: hypothetical protein M3R17_06635 [Bacteroidota bacterium]|nr:hypothetical protein [Bacteroidota bacterium]